MAFIAMVPAVYALIIAFDFKNVSAEGNKKMIWTYGIIFAAAFILTLICVCGVQIAFLSFIFE